MINERYILYDYKRLFLSPYLHTPHPRAHPSTTCEKWVEIEVKQFNGYISAADISKFTCFEIDTWYNDQLSSSLQLNFGLLGSFTILHASISDRAFS